MNFYLYFLCLVIELKALKVYLVNQSVTDGKHLKLVSESRKPVEDTKEELISEYEYKTKPKCNEQLGTDTEKIICVEKYYKDGRPTLENIYFERKWKHKLLDGGKPYSELTRGVISNSFSTDYIDINDFSRHMDDDDFAEDYLSIGDITRDEPNRRNLPYEIIQSKKPRAVKHDSDSDSSDDVESDEKSNNRFQVVDNKSSDSEDVVEEEEEISKEVSKEKEEDKEVPKDNSDGGDGSEEGVKPREPKYVYLQGRNRYVKEDSRKRLQHFLPKRSHWKEDEVQKLGYFWFNGPRGRYPEFVNAMEI